MVPKDIELRHLRYFLAVAEERNFSRAALRLGIQQPPLSQQIKQLEEILGYRIFDRNSRGAQLTPSGESFEQFARLSLATLAEGQHVSQLVARGISGSFTLGFAASLLVTNLTGAIRCYREAYPDVRLVLREMTTDVQLDALRRGEIDVGLGREAGSEGDIISDRILSEPLYAFFPKRHHLAARKLISPQALSEEPFVLFPRHAGRKFHDRIVSVCQEHGFTPRVIQEATEWFTVLRLVSAEIGITIAPRSVLSMCDANVTAVKISPIKYTSVVLLRRDIPRQGPASAFSRILRASMKVHDTDSKLDDEN